MFRRGLDITGENDLLYAGIAYAYYNCANIGIEQEEYIEKAERYANKALALNSQSAEAHLVLGLLDQAFRGDQRAALYRLKQSAAISPDDPRPLVWLVVTYFSLGRAEAADAAVRRLQLIDPLAPMSRMAGPISDAGSGRYSSALDFPWHEMPPLPMFVMLHALMLAWNKQLNGARALLLKSVPAEWDDAPADMARMLRFAVDGDAKAIHHW